MKYPLDEKFDASLVKRQIKTKLDGKVELQNIAFGYSRLKDPIVSDFSFKIECGSSIAFVGSSGCGKSTVSKIVSGLYKPWQGRLLFDDIPVEEIPSEVINASVSTVSQNITLFQAL